MIELRHLRYFLALAKHLHFAKAADSVNVTQPSLSRQIAALEAELGCELVVRNSRSVRLTAAGESLQRDAHALLQQMDATIRATQAVARGDRGELRVAFTSMIAFTSFPVLLKRYTARHPDVTLNLTERLPPELIHSVETGESDLCLAFRTPVSPPLAYTPLHAEKLCIALPARHPLATQNGLTLANLAREPFILSPSDVSPALHDLIMQACRRAGFEPEVRMHTHLQGTIVNLVAEGLGVSVVPEAMKRTRQQDVVYIPLADAPAIELGIVWRTDNHNPCLDGFLQAASIVA